MATTIVAGTQQLNNDACLYIATAEHRVQETLNTKIYINLMQHRSVQNIFLKGGV